MEMLRSLKNAICSVCQSEMLAYIHVCLTEITSDKHVICVSGNFKNLCA